MVLLPIIFLILPNLLPSTADSFYSCIDDGGNHTSTNRYKANLDAVLSTLPTNIDRYGFYNASAGQTPDRANAIVLCRGDVDLDACQKCVQDAIVDLTNSFCPGLKQGVTWYNDFQCMLRYSNASIVGTYDTTPGVCSSKIANATSPDRFEEDLRKLLDNLRIKAANGGSRKKFAAGNITGPDFQTIFALSQCTPDMSEEQCDQCLRNSAADIKYSACFDSTKRGGTHLSRNCNFRYEIYPFFNEVAATPVPVLGSLAPSETAIPLPGKDGGIRTRTIVIIVVSSMCVIQAIFTVVCITMRRKQKPTGQHESDIGTIESLQYAFSTIRAATNDFSDANKIGRGGFGIVYKGMLPNGQEIAIKRLTKDSGQGSLEFQNEVKLLAKLLHKNLVRLMGFCLEGIEKLLIYEFVPNGSLDRIIFDSIKRMDLTWDKRSNIIRGIARGLLYLHEDSRLKIIHRDLKASNVLLDEKMIPKIADFGMARLFDQEETQGNTSKIAGTYGYMPPEYAMNGQFSVKSDIFSFGVLLLEIISGKNATQTQSEEPSQNLLSFAWKNWREGMYVNIVDPFLWSDSGSMSDILRCIHIGMLCVQQNAADRPTIASVVLMLSGFSITMAAPYQPAFFFGSGGDSVLSSLPEDSSSKGHIATHSEGNASKNDASVSELYAR